MIYIINGFRWPWYSWRVKGQQPPTKTHEQSATWNYSDLHSHFVILQVTGTKRCIPTLSLRSCTNRKPPERKHHPAVLCAGRAGGCGWGKIHTPQERNSGQGRHISSLNKTQLGQGCAKCLLLHKEEISEERDNCSPWYPVISAARIIIQHLFFFFFLMHQVLL